MLGYGTPLFMFTTRQNKINLCQVKIIPANHFLCLYVCFIWVDPNSV